MTTSSGATCLYPVSRERGLQKLHSVVAPTMLPQRDLLRLAMRADQRNVFLDVDQKGEKRNGGTSVARRVSSKARSGQMPGSVCGDPMMVMDSPSIADGANLTDTCLERIELLNDHLDEVLLQCAQSRRVLDGFLCLTWLVGRDVASFQPFAAAKAQGKAYSEAARGQKGHQVEWLNQSRKQLISTSDVGPFLGSRDLSERGTRANSGEIHGCAECQQVGTHSP